MVSRVGYVSRYAIASIIFLAVCIVGTRCQAGEMLMHQDDTVNIMHVVAIENDTEQCEFQVFYGSQAASAFVAPKSIFTYQPEQALNISNAQRMMVIKCSKGSYLPVYIQFGGLASGKVTSGYDGPYYLTMWLGYPQLPENAKTHVRCLIKSGTIGKVGIKIGPKGDYRFVAYDNVEFID